MVGRALRFLYAGMARRAKAEHDLFETGTKAPAVVESVETMGTVLNNVNTQIGPRTGEKARILAEQIT